MRGVCLRQMVNDGLSLHSVERIALIHGGVIDDGIVLLLEVNI